MATNPRATPYTLPDALLGLSGEELARKRLQQRGDLYEQGGWWKLRWRVDMVCADGTIKRGWSKPVTIGPSKGNGAGLKAMTEKEARRDGWDRYLSRIDNNVRNPQSICTFEQYVNVRFKADRYNYLREGTKLSYDNALAKYILPILGKIPLRDVRRDDCQQVIVLAQAHGLSPKTQARIRDLMSGIFLAAEDDEWSTGNPARKLKLPPLTAKRKIVHLTMEQVETAAVAIDAVCPSWLRIGDLVRFLALAGLRIGEGLGLRWKRINLTDKQQGQIPPYSFVVAEQFTMGRWGEPKTQEGERTVPITSAMWVILERARELSPFTESQDTVWCSRNGSPLLTPNLQEWVRVAKKALDMPTFSFHSLRHTAATLADQAGMTLAERMKVLGHRDKTTAMHYTHADHELVRRKMERVN